jgi:peroxiredoxin
MRRNIARFALLALLACSAPTWADGPSKAKLGEKIPNLVFHDAAGKQHALHDLKDQKAIVVVFLSFECPVSNSYCRPLADMHKEYAKHGVSFVGLTVSDDDSPAIVAKQAKEFELSFPIYRDTDLAAARAFEADYTPEVFVLDGDYRLRYRGRIDDSWSERLKRHAEVTRHDLKQVIGELLSGRPVATPVTQPIGCRIDRDAKPAAKVGAVTYYKDVLPILQDNCQTCHRPGESGPFSLMKYSQAVNWAPDIKSYTQKHVMPPWKPNAHGVAMQNERRLGDRDIATLAAWADNGTPAGDPKDSPPPRTFTEGWQLGTPDLILSPSDEFVLGPTGKDKFRCFVMPTNLKEDAYVTAVELRPGNPRVVHHLLLFIDGTGQARKLQENEKAKKPQVDESHPQEKTNPDWDKGPGYTVAMGVGFLPQGGLSGWSPGIQPKHLPEGAAYFLPKNSDVVMQIHYHRDGRVERDQTKVGLFFAKRPTPRRYASGVVAGGAGAGPFSNFLWSIPAGDDHFKLRGEEWAHKDFTLYSISPHMHMLGRSIKLTMTPPGTPPGETKTLIDIENWDYNWQEIYFLKEPIQIKTGTRFQVDAVYDNSTKNPMNPFNPPRRITYGEQTFNEMCYVFLGGTPGTPAAPIQARGLSVRPTPPPATK